VLDAGAEDMTAEDDAYEIKVAPEKFEAVRKALEAKKIPALSAEITKAPQNTVKVTGDQAGKVLKLVEQLDDHDDVQHVYANFDIDEKELSKLAV
jgi:transcriptional/translational regulatory protein YebC/TACO1